MSEKDINRWHEAVLPKHRRPEPWVIGHSWDTYEVQPIPDCMLAELAQLYNYSGTPWNCRSLPLSPSDREFMYLLYYSMHGLIARFREAERRVDELEAENAELRRDAKRNEAAANIVLMLITLKARKDRIGKDRNYELHQPQAWTLAKEFLQCAMPNDYAAIDAALPPGEVQMLDLPAFTRPTDADCYQVLRTSGICDGTTHLRITDQVDAAIRAALSAIKRA